MTTVPCPICGSPDTITMQPLSIAAQELEHRCNHCQHRWRTAIPQPQPVTTPPGDGAVELVLLAAHDVEAILNTFDEQGYRRIPIQHLQEAIEAVTSLLGVFNYHASLFNIQPPGWEANLVNFLNALVTIQHGRTKTVTLPLSLLDQ